MKFKKNIYNKLIVQKITFTLFVDTFWYRVTLFFNAEVCECARCVIDQALQGNNQKTLQIFALQTSVFMIMRFKYDNKYQFAISSHKHSSHQWPCCSYGKNKLDKPLFHNAFWDCIHKMMPYNLAKGGILKTQVGYVARFVSLSNIHIQRSHGNSSVKKCVKLVSMQLSVKYTPYIRVRSHIGFNKADHMLI